jgi:tRNA threonylcarbamoyladenosine biosynthesis protein TsaB
VKLLAVDTATEACTVGLLADGVIRARFELAPRRHAALVLSMIEQLLGEAGIGPGELDAVGFGQGPGAFTGVRIAAAVAQGVAFASDLPVVAVSSLAATAQHLADDAGSTRGIVAFDARMGEVYLGIYETDSDGLVRPVITDRLVPPAQAPEVPAGLWTGAGSGWSSCRDELQKRYGARVSVIVPEVYPHGAALVRLAAGAFARGEGGPAEQALPVYLRNRVAEVPSDRTPR